MRDAFYLPTVDEANKPLVIKVRVIGEQGQWRMLHQVGERYRDEGEIVVHARHLVKDWLAAWMKAKRISRFRTSVRNGQTSAR